MNRRSITRRRFCKTLGSTVAALPAALAGSGAWSQSTPRKATPFHVALIACPDYDPDRLLEALRTGWTMSRPPAVKGKHVVIKPNMADVSPDRPIHTDPRLVEAMVLHLIDLDAREIVLAEGTAHNRDTEWLFRQSGYEALARRQGIRIVDLNYDDVTEVENPSSRPTLLKTMRLPRTVLEADVIISMPKMKTHRLAGITLSLKNMFGIVPGMVYGWPKNILHWNGIPKSICEINQTVKTDYTVVDGIIGMERHGPIMGTPKKAEVLVMGDNALAVDATAARVMGVDPACVDYMAMAQNIRLGSVSPRLIEIAGERLDDVRSGFKLDPYFDYLKASRR